LAAWASRILIGSADLAICGIERVMAAAPEVASIVRLEIMGLSLPVSYNGTLFSFIISRPIERCQEHSGDRTP
jgi:hypothetical protein